MGMAADVVKVTEAALTFVAADSKRMPRPLPPHDAVPRSFAIETMSTTPNPSAS
jgi:acyl-CoA thioesterase YciA